MAKASKPRRPKKKHRIKRPPASGRFVSSNAGQSARRAATANETGTRARGHKTRTAAESDAVIHAPPPDNDSPESRADAVDRPEASGSVRIIGVGASAGGLEAFTALLRGLGDELGAAIVFVQHLSADHRSRLPELLQAATRLPVIEAQNAQKLEPDHIYVIPPRYDLELSDGELRTTPRAIRGAHLPIDSFFRSLADTAGERAIGILLSGTGSDGVQGLRAIKAAGGIVIVQSPDSAVHDSMPRAALATGVEDLCLPPSKIAGELVRIVESSYVRHARPRRPGDDLAIHDDELARILAHLNERQGADFRGYKKPTLRRRVQRRMVLHALTNPDQYLKLLDSDAAERQRLSEDILIQVTRFFRDPGAFDALAEQVIPRILSDRLAEVPIRIWTPGCATGEETYSVAITLHECLGTNAGAVPATIFGTDISERSITQARAGIYPESIAGDVSPTRLRQYFVKTERGYRIRDSLREMCVFARQDLTRDPPFSHLDLVLCRNVLIYLSGELQKRLMSVFHYALKPSGFLMLGEVETVGAFVDLFEITDKKHRIYSRRSVETPRSVVFGNAGSLQTGPQGLVRASSDSKNVQARADRVLLDRYAPAGVLVDPDYQVLQTRGRTGPFLELSPGSASLNLLKLARGGLAHSLRAVLNAAKTRNAPVRRERLQLNQNGKRLTFAVEVVPVDRYFLVLFDARTQRTAPDSKSPATISPKDGKGRRVAELQQELANTREQLQSIIQDLEAANEELQSANEEILSSNEELQSTNEELDTAREELQSTNEELNTLNEELHGRNEELMRANSDLSNLFASLRIPIAIVSGDLKVRNFTPVAEHALNLLPADIGRPIHHIRSNLESVDLESILHQVIDTMQPVEQEVRDTSGSWHSLRVHPYKNLDGRIDGAVLALFDISKVKEHERAISAARDFAVAVTQAVQHPLIMLDRKLTVRSVNRAFTETFGVSESDAAGHRLTELSDGDWNISALRARLDQMLAENGEFDGFVVERSMRGIGKRLVFSGRRVEMPGEQAPEILLSIRDITGSNTGVT